MGLGAKVSFIVPARNRVQELKAALSSCLAQTMDDWEAIVVDDHSDQENVEKVVKDLVDSRICYIRQKLNQTGEAAGRELAIHNAQTNILITLDSDDLNYPHRAARCLELLDECTPKMIYTRVHHFSKKNPSGQTKKVLQPFNKTLLEMMNFITNPGTAFNRSAYTIAGDHYDKSLTLATDYDQFLRMARSGVNISEQDEVHVCYRKHQRAVTFGTTKQLHEAIMQIRIKHKIPPFPLERIYEYAIPELSNNIRNNPAQLSLWKDDRWKI